MALKCALCVNAGRVPRPVMVRYEDVRSNKTISAIFCAFCDGMEEWPNWSRGLKDRAK